MIGWPTCLFTYLPAYTLPISFIVRLQNLLTHQSVREPSLLPWKSLAPALLIRLCAVQFPPPTGSSLMIAHRFSFCFLLIFPSFFFFFFLSCNSCSPITSYSLVSRCSSDLQTFRCMSECCSKLLCCVRVRSACICACSSGGRSFGQRGEGRELQGEGCILNSGVFLFCFGFFLPFPENSLPQL